MSFQKGKSGNPAGRPAGIRKLDRGALQRAVATHAAPHAVELIQRGVERALNGDAAALAGMLHLLGIAMLSPEIKPHGMSAGTTPVQRAG